MSQVKKGSRTTIEAPMFDDVADADDYEESDDPTPITHGINRDALLMKIGILVERQSIHVKRIPEIDRKLTAVATKQDGIEQRQGRMDNRLARIERNGHKCTSADDIKRNTDAIHSATANRRKAIGSAVASAVGVAIVVIGAAWNTGGKLEGLSQRFEGERALHAAQFSSLKAQVDRLPTKVDLPTKQQMTSFRRVAKNDEFEERCATLTASEKDHLTMSVERGRLPPALLCP